MNKGDLQKAMDLNTWEEFVGNSSTKCYLCPHCNEELPVYDLAVPTLVDCEWCEKPLLAIPSKLNKAPLYVTYKADAVHQQKPLNATPDPKKPSSAGVPVAEKVESSQHKK